MNRKEQILAAAQEYAGKRYRNDEDRAFAIKDFQAGAQWADSTQEDAIIDNLILSELREIRQLTIVGTKSVLTMDDVVILTGLSKSHVYKLVCLKKIPYYKSSGGKFTYFRKSEIEDWLCAYRVPTASETEQQAVNYAVSKRGRPRTIESKLNKFANNN